MGSCRRSCWRISRALSTLLLPLGDRRRLVERLGCCCRRASTSSWRRGAPLGSRLCWTSSAVYSVAQLPPSVSTTLATAMLQFMCCHAIWTVSFARAALETVCIQLAAPTWRGTSVPRLFQGAHTAKRQQVHGLGFDEAVWRLFAESASVFGPMRVVNSRPAADIAHWHGCTICCIKGCCSACIIVL